MEQKDQVKIQGTILLKRGTKANLIETFSVKNPLPLGEPAYETDTGKLKVGNGKDAYSDLSYISGDEEKLNRLQERIDAFLNDAIISGDVVDTLKEIQDILNAETNLSDILGKIAQFEELHKTIEEDIDTINAIADAAQTKEEVETAIDTTIDSLNLSETYEPIGEGKKWAGILRSEIEASNKIAAEDRQAIKEAYTAADKAISDNYIRENEAIRNEFVTANVQLSNSLSEEIIRAKDAEAQTLTDAKAYTDKVKNDLLGEGISETFDTLVEIQDWINGDGINTTELTEAIAEEAAKRLVQDEALNTRVDDLTAQHTKDIEIINDEFEKAYDQQTEAFNNYIGEVKAELEEDDKNNLAEAKSYTDSAKAELFGDGSANFPTIVALSAKTQELIDIFPSYVEGELQKRENKILAYVDQKIGEIENGSY